MNDTIARSPIRSTNTVAKLNKALAAAQALYPTVEKRHKANVTSKETRKFIYSFMYADLADVMNAVRPALAAQGLAVQHFPLMRDRTMFVVCRLSHESGEWIEAEYPVQQISDGLNHQVLGGNLTFAKRQSLCAVTGIAAEEDVGDAQVDAAGDSGWEPEQDTRAAPPRREPPRRSEPEKVPPMRHREPVPVDPLLVEMSNQSTAESLKLWHSQNEAKLRAKPQAWQDEFYARYDARLADLKEAAAA